MFHSQARNFVSRERGEKSGKNVDGAGPEVTRPDPQHSGAAKGPSNYRRPEARRRNLEARISAVAALSILPRENDNMLII
jgi:hypothetical protein